ncbi:MAG: hypothetical protein CMH46_10800 [Muricauda sp.]|nr:MULTISPECIES: TetR/AcrR family transcriptional regulator [unclassified Allomuricauda]MAU16012.1 hypothetical protein [Allomuricauda sp.]|tara:strand:+ start:9775 stop:10386 length:612 start_codon:yes stop_codon:yes gene_type:complete
METTPFHKKDIILEKASKMVNTYGIRSLSMDDVAKACGVSKRTIYKYFQNKSDLIDQVVTMKINTFREKLEEISTNSDNAVIELDLFFKVYKKSISSYSPTFLWEFKRHNLDFFAKVSEVNHNIILPFVLKNIERGQHEGLYKKELDKEKLIPSILNMLGHIFTGDAISDTENINSTLDFFGKLLMHRLVTVEGLHYLEAQKP